MWSMPQLLKDVSVPVSWMEPLRISNLNLWLGDGLFRNIVHHDPDDNLLCLIHGARRSQAGSYLQPHASNDLFASPRILILFAVADCRVLFAGGHVCPQGYDKRIVHPLPGSLG
jgi:hypothetical protein